MNTSEHSPALDCTTGPTIITLRVRLGETESKFIQNAIQAAIQAYRQMNAKRIKPETDLMDAQR
jgi:hypothetical protein